MNNFDADMVLIAWLSLYLFMYMYISGLKNLMANKKFALVNFLFFLIQEIYFNGFYFVAIKAWLFALSIKLILDNHKLSEDKSK